MHFATESHHIVTHARRWSQNPTTTLKDRQDRSLALSLYTSMFFSENFIVSQFLKKFVNVWIFVISFLTIWNPCHIMVFLPFRRYGVLFTFATPADLIVLCCVQQSPSFFCGIWFWREWFLSPTVWGFALFFHAQYINFFNNYIFQNILDHKFIYKFAIHMFKKIHVSHFLHLFSICLLLMQSGGIICLRSNRSVENQIIMKTEILMGYICTIFYFLC